MNLRQFWSDLAYYNPVLRIRARCLSLIRIFPSRIPDPGSKSHRILDPNSLKYFLPQNFLINSRKCDQNVIPGTDLFPSRIPDPGIEKNTGSRIPPQHCFSPYSWDSISFVMLGGEGVVDAIKPTIWLSRVFGPLVHGIWLSYLNHSCSLHSQLLIRTYYMYYTSMCPLNPFRY
jgi:hypothetical protein